MDKTDESFHTRDIVIADKDVNDMLKVVRIDT